MCPLLSPLTRPTVLCAHPLANAQYGDVFGLYVNAMMYTRGGPYLAGMAAALVTLSPPPSSEQFLSPLVPSEVQTACTPHQPLPSRTRVWRRDADLTSRCWHWCFYLGSLSLALFTAYEGNETPLYASDPEQTPLRTGPVWWWLSEDQKQSLDYVLYLGCAAGFGLGCAGLIVEMLRGRAQCLKRILSSRVWVPFARYGRPVAPRLAAD